MRVWNIGYRFNFDKFDINHHRSTLFSRLDERHPVSDTGRWWLPTRFGALEPRPFIPVSKAALWPDVIDGYSLGLVISERFAALVRDYCPAQAELFPVDVVGPRRSRPPMAYFYLNVVHEVDAANLYATRVRLSEEFPDIKAMFLPNDRPAKAESFDWILDPDRIPARALIFTLKYVRNLFVTGELGERLLAAKLTWLKLNPVLLRRENSVQRRARLAKFRRICRGFKPPPEPIRIADLAELESVLGMALPPLVRGALGEEQDYRRGEVFGFSRIAEATRTLRKWKELDWPEHLVAISDDGRGGYYALDTSKVRDGDCPVVYFDHELAAVDRKSGRITPELEVAAPTFAGWIARLKRGGSPLPR